MLAYGFCKQKFFASGKIKKKTLKSKHEKFTDAKKALKFGKKF